MHEFPKAKNGNVRHSFSGVLGIWQQKNCPCRLSILGVTALSVFFAERGC